MFVVLCGDRTGLQEVKGRAAEGEVGLRRGIGDLDLGLRRVVDEVAVPTVVQVLVYLDQASAAVH